MRPQFAQPAKQLDVLVVALSERDAGVDGDVAPGESRPRELGQVRLHPANRLHDHIVVHRGAVRPPLWHRVAVVQHIARPRAGSLLRRRDAQGKAADVVDDLGAGIQGRPRDGALVGIDRDDMAFSGETGDHLAGKPGLERLVQDRPVGPGALGADIDDVRAALRRASARASAPGSSRPTPSPENESSVRFRMPITTGRSMPKERLRSRHSATGSRNRRSAAACFEPRLSSWLASCRSSATLAATRMVEPVRSSPRPMALVATCSRSRSPTKCAMNGAAASAAS